ncbi:hypothetical protein EJB05_16259 [Eragrostis curvula]|uniref:Uncharacterized protein n=1 Tax=Eragrostis curvula TaxID=38414 RepID=A0A5J9SGV7_9POAL|nr:hypothetical protein EJB05_56176 [Eragrostis curvula]TVU34427.1 hypothetical protein EJB05_16259 [Eragrostis curvula]
MAGLPALPDCQFAIAGSSEWGPHFWFRTGPPKSQGRPWPDPCRRWLAVACGAYQSVCGRGF